MSFRRAQSWCLVVLLLVVSSTAAGQDRIDRQVSLLKTSSDFRVRTQAALALGSSKNQRAVQPLCGGLEDTNTTVRIASAAALGKLNLGGADCLKRRLPKEPSSSVKGTIQRALARLGAVEAVIGPETRFYVAIGRTGHDGKRSDIDDLVRRGMAKTVSKVGAFAMAPADETIAQASSVLSKHSQLKGFYLAPKLSLTYAGGRLNIKLSVAMLSYPDKNVIGQFSKTVASPTSEPDPSLEAELVSYAAEAAMKQFTEVAPRL